MKTATFCTLAAAMTTSRHAGLLYADDAPANDKPDGRPNILFAFADDWSWPEPVASDNNWFKMPAFERICNEGVVFNRAFVTAPSCTPSRASVLTGQWHWRLEEDANLFGTLPAKFAVYPDLLEKAGYHVGYTGKGWGPGNVTAGGRTRNPAGKEYASFEAFMAERPKGKPFCFWFGSHQPHRSYRPGSGVNAGLKLADVKVPACLPDCETTRSDLCDYAAATQRYDHDAGQIIKSIEAAGELDHTMVVMSGDNGLPFPRGKCNIYDTGTRVPLAIRWPDKIKSHRSVDDFVSLADLCPTFLQAAGVAIPADVDGKSLMNVLASDKNGQVDPSRDHVLTGMERHAAPARDGALGYPMRAYRTADFLYIRNFKPDRWPAGDPPAFMDIDGGPTKKYMIDHRDDPAVKPLYELAFGKRPAEELYDLRKDPNQLKNVAADPAYAQMLTKLSEALNTELKATKDPRVIGGGDKFDEYSYRGKVYKSASKTTE
ncbi:MAG: sulfatase-like hydrolase/transferase [Phycisphaera sp.]|nr:sulfatase-like hydrolase/transferase [Phycisphaera sp.]